MNKIFIKYKGGLMLLLTALIWGIAFLFQKNSMNYIGPFTFTSFRGLIAASILIPFSFISDKCKQNKNIEKGTIDYKTEIIGGILSGLFLFLGSSLQQYSLVYTSVSKGGFLTSTYMVFVPIFGLLLKKKTSLKNWLCVTGALIGSYILTCFEAMISGESFLPNFSDFILILSSTCFAMQILMVDRFVSKCNPVRLNGYSFFWVFVYSGIVALFSEKFTFDNFGKYIGGLLFVGILSSCIAYSFQNIGQKYVNPTTSSLILSLESVFALLSGVIFLKEELSIYEIIGCAIIFICVVISQVSLPIKFKGKEENRCLQ